MNIKFLKSVLTLLIVTCTLLSVQAQLGVGVVTPHASSIFEANSNNRGALLPRMTTTDINAIVSPARGLLAYDSTVNCLKQFNGVIWECVNKTISGNIIAMTPFGSGQNTEVTFDGMKIRWGLAASNYDVIEIGTISGTRSIRYSSYESWIGSSQFDAATNVWASENFYYTSSPLVASNNTTFPHNQTISSTYQTMGNYGMFQHNIRIVYLEDVTNSARYRITCVKKASTGEIASPQIGIMDIYVERMGITTDQIFSAGTGISITSGVISTTGSGASDHDWYEVTLPSTMTTTAPTSISNPAYRRGQTHFLSGTNVQDNNSYMNIRPESNRPYGVLIQNNITNGALSAGTEQNNIYNTMTLSGSTAYTNSLKSNYNLISQTGTANSTIIRVTESDANFAGGTHSDVIGTHSALVLTGGAMTLGRGLYGAVVGDGTTTMGEIRAVEGIAYNNTSRTMNLTGSSRGGLFQFVNYAGGTVNNTGHMIGVQGGLNNSGTIATTTSGLHYAAGWFDNTNNPTGYYNNPNGTVMGIYNSNYNNGRITAASAYGIHNQLYNDSTMTLSNSATGIYGGVTNNNGNSISAPTTIGGDFKIYNSGTMTGTAIYGAIAAFGNQISGATSNHTSEASGGHFSINNVAGATMTTPSLYGVRSYFQNTGTFNNNAGNGTAIYGNINNTGTWTNSATVKGGHFAIDNGAAGTMTLSSAMYGLLSQVNNNGNLTSPQIYSSITQINLAGTTNVSGEVVGTYSDIATVSGAVANITGAYGSRSYVSNAAGATMTSQTSMGINSFVQNYGQYNVIDNGGVFGMHNYISNNSGGTINNNKPSNPGLYGTYNYIDNYGTINGIGNNYGSYNFVRNRDGGTSAANNMTGIEGFAQIYNSTHNRPAGVFIGGSFHADLNNASSVLSSLNVANKWGLQSYSRRDGANTTETITDERGLYSYVYHDPLGTSNVTSGFAGIFNYDHNGAGTVINSYGVHVQNTGTGNKTNAYGVFISDVIGTNTYGFYENSNDPNYFAGRLGIGTTGSTSYQLMLSTDNAALPGTSVWTIYSDENLKNIKGAYTKGLSEISKLSPIIYKYKDADKRKFDSTVLAKDYVGLKAQDVQKIFPEAVNMDSDGYLNLNMHAINIALINAVKELNTKIDSVQPSGSDKIQEQIKTLAQSIQDIELMIKSCNLPCTTNLNNDPTQVARLYQNYPNPFSTETRIEYFLPEIKTSARMHFYDMLGQELSSKPVTQIGKGYVTIEAGTMAAGQYLYTLIADGVEIGTKKMILTK
jgi:trimeric autotransporter adhesin